MLTLTTRALYEATNTDFKIVCQDREWNTHCVFLQRCPIFDKVISPTGDFQWRVSIITFQRPGMSTKHKAIANLELLLLQETVESMMTIRNFEPFEVEWLLRAIYADSWLGKLIPSHDAINARNTQRKRKQGQKRKQRTSPPHQSKLTI